jgi:tetratricopeptide (TPR) repeat protein
MLLRPSVFSTGPKHPMLRLTSTLLLVLGLHATAMAQSADLAARSREASGAMKAGRFDEAARLYRDMLRARPDEPGLLMNLGMALAMSGNEAEALAPLRRAIELDPKLLPAHLFLGSSHLALGQPDQAIAPLERTVALQPSEIEHRRLLAQAYSATGRTTDAITQLRKVTDLAPKLPGGWFALGHAYNAMTQEALSSFEQGEKAPAWQQLLVADALFADGRLTDAFAMYRAALDELPGMITIHESIARIYEQTGHKDWAAQERAALSVPPGACAKRKAMCAFRAGRYHEALAGALAANDPESRYWRVRAATELALAAFKRLEALPDSRERREMRATLAREQRRYVDAIAELQAALKFAPDDPALVDELGTAYYLARDYEQAAATLAPLVKTIEDARLLTMYGDSLVQLQRIDEALPLLQRAVKLQPADPTPRLTLGRAYAQKGDFAAAIPLLERELERDQDGSVHVQLARAYAAVGKDDRAAPLLERSRALQRASQERAGAQAERTITPPVRK